MTYALHEELVDPARNGRHGLLWTVAGCGLITAITYFLTLMLVQGLRNYHESRGNHEFAENLFTGTTPQSLLTVLFSFAAWLVAVWVTLRWVHNRRFLPVLGPDVLGDFFRVLSALIVLNLVVLALPPWDLLAETRPGLDAAACRYAPRRSCSAATSSSSSPPAYARPSCGWACHRCCSRWDITMPRWGRTPG